MTGGRRGFWEMQRVASRKRGMYTGGPMPPSSAGAQEMTVKVDV